MPPTGSTLPRSVISPVIARSLRTGRPRGQRGQRRRHRHAGRRAVLGHRAGRDVEVDRLAREDRRVDAERLGVRADVGQRRLRALAHHVAEHAGEDQPLLAARHHRRLDEEDVAAGRRPGQAGGHAGAVGALGDLVEEARPAEVRRRRLSAVTRTGAASRPRRCRRATLRAMVAISRSRFAHARLARVVAHDARGAPRRSIDQLARRSGRARRSCFGTRYCCAIWTFSSSV